LSPTHDRLSLDLVGWFGLAFELFLTGVVLFCIAALTFGSWMVASVGSLALLVVLLAVCAWGSIRYLRISRRERRVREPQLWAVYTPVPVVTPASLFGASGILKFAERGLRADYRQPQIRVYRNIEHGLLVQPERRSEVPMALLDDVVD
jgi:hypothetical protein